MKEKVYKSLTKKKNDIRQLEKLHEKICKLYEIKKNEGIDFDCEKILNMTEEEELKDFSPNELFIIANLIISELTRLRREWKEEHDGIKETLKKCEEEFLNETDSTMNNEG